MRIILSPWEYLWLYKAFFYPLYFSASFDLLFILFVLDIVFYSRDFSYHRAIFKFKTEAPKCMWGRCLLYDGQMLVWPFLWGHHTIISWIVKFCSLRLKISPQEEPVSVLPRVYKHGCEHFGSWAEGGARNEGVCVLI